MAKQGKLKAAVKALTRGRKRTTNMTFTSEDLTVLGKVLKAGQVLLPTKHPVLWRLKAAMTRMGVSTEKGL